MIALYIIFGARCWSPLSGCYSLSVASQAQSNTERAQCRLELLVLFKTLAAATRPSSTDPSDPSHAALSAHPTRVHIMDTTGSDGTSCEDCARQLLETSYCESCDAVFCAECWERQISHRKGRRGLTGIAHEKADFTIAKRLENILTPTADPVEQQQLHANDIETAWFGVVRNGSFAKPGLHDYGRYPELMKMSFTGQWSERWPQIVSFIGQTGTLVSSSPCTDH